VIRQLGPVKLIGIIAVAVIIVTAGTVIAVTASSGSAVVTRITGDYAFTQRATLCTYAVCDPAHIVIHINCPASGSCTATAPPVEWGGSIRVALNGKTIYFSGPNLGAVRCGGKAVPATITLDLTVVSWSVGHDSVRRPKRIQGYFNVSSPKEDGCRAAQERAILTSG